MLLETELRRLAHRAGLDQTAVTAVLAGIDIADLERAEYRTAGLLAGPTLRTLDALHVAAALRQDADGVVTYDHRQGAAVQAAGMQVVAPDRIAGDAP